MLKLRKIVTLAICAVVLAVVMPMLRVDAAETQTMKSSEQMIEVLKKMEGFSAYPYWDYGQYSIGYGTKCPNDKVSLYSQTGITEAQAQKMLEEELEAFEKNVSDFARTYGLKLTKNQFDALVSFTYNCGPAWMSDKTGYFNNAVRSGDMGSDLIYGMCLYSKAGNDYILTERRMCEANMYINGVYKASNDEGETYPANYKWVFLDGNGGEVRYAIYGYDAAKKPTVSVQFSKIPTGVDSKGNVFAYTLAGWYTYSGTKVDNLTTALTNGQKLYAKWKDPDGNIVNLTGKQDVVEKKIKITNTNVNVRSGPGLGYGVVTTVDKGTVLTVTAVQVADGYTWGKTEKGWLSLAYTNYFEDENSTSSSETFSKAATVTGSDVRYRTEPSTGTVVGKKQKGDRITIVQEKTVGGTVWGKMSDGYWISMDYVTYDDEKITSISLVTKPTKLKYADTKQPLKLEGSVLLVTYANGTSEAMTLNRDMVTSFKATSADKATVTVSYGGKSLSFQVTLGKTGDLIITKQPASVYVADGKQAMVTVTASGDGLKYQWYFRNPGDTAYSKSSLTGNSYYVTMKEKLSGRKVYCVVTDKYGDSVKSDVATLAVKATITKQPTNAFVDNGGKVAVSLSATGDDITYTWYFKNKTASSFSKSSITTNTYTMTMDSTRSGRQIYCVVTDAYGNTVKSNVVVLCAKPQITSQPAYAYAKNGVKVTATIQATGEDLKYAWYFCNVGASSYSKSSLTGDSYYVTMKDSVSGRKVYCVVTDKYGNTAKSQEILLINKATIAQQPQNVMASLGEKAIVSIKVYGDGLKYQWYFCNAGASSYSKSSLTGSSYSVTMKESMIGRKVYCVVTDKYGNSVKTGVATISAKASFATQPKNSSATIGQKATTSVKTVGTGISYQWYFKDVGASSYSKSSLTGNSYSVTMKESNSGRQIYCVIKDKYGNTAKSDVVTLTAKAAIAEQPKNASAPMGAQVKTTVKATGVGLKYEWYFKNATASTYTKSSITTNTYTMNVDATRSGRQVYCVVKDQYGNSVKSKVVTLTAKVSITEQPKNASAAIGSQVKVTVKATGVGLKYEWYIKNVGATTWGKSSLTGNSYAMTMKESVCGRQVYCVVKDQYGNSVKSDVVTLTTAVTILQQPVSVSADLGAEVSTRVEASGTDLRYQWYYCEFGSSTYYKSGLTGPEYYATMNATRAGRKIYCQITDKYGNIAKTDVVTLMANCAITSQPQSKTMAMGQRFTTSVEAVGVDLQYQWYICAPGEKNYIKSSLTGPAYYVTVKESIVGRTAYCEITDRHGNKLKTDVITITGVDAVKELRTQLEARNPQIVITYLQNELLPEENTLAVDVLNEALAHTGVGTQGDYIYRHIKNLSYEAVCKQQDNGYQVTLTYNVEYRTTAEQETQVDAKVKAILDKLNVYNASDYQKVKAVYKYLCDNVEAPIFVDAMDYTTYGALVENSAVCHGFSTAFYRLMLELDVDVRLISGTIGTTKHGWNIVKINGVYYNVDATKDAGFAFANYNYFLKADSSLNKHVRDEEYTTAEFAAQYPMAEKDYQ